MHHPTPEHGLMRSICRLGTSDGNAQAVVSSVLNFVASSTNVAISCALCTLLLRRAAQMSSRAVNAADLATIVLQHMQSKWGETAPSRLHQLTGEAEEIVAKTRSTAEAALHQLAKQAGGWDRGQMIAAISALPCHIDTTPQRYVASVECRMGDEHGQVVVTDMLSISVKDPLSLRPIAVPARGKGCTHVQPFDLDSFLQYAERSFKTTDGDDKDAGLAKCPVCSQPLQLEDLYVDKFLRDCFAKLSNPSRLLRLSLCVATGAIEVVADERPEVPDDGAKNNHLSQPRSPAVSSPPPSQTPPAKRPREMEIEGHLLTFDEDD